MSIINLQKIKVLPYQNTAVVDIFRWQSVCKNNQFVNLFEMHVLQTNMNRKYRSEVYWVTHLGGEKISYVLFSHLLLVLLNSFLISDIVLKSHSLSSVSVLVTSLLYGQEREKTSSGPRKIHVYTYTYNAYNQISIWWYPECVWDTKNNLVSL